MSVLFKNRSKKLSLYIYVSEPKRKCQAYGIIGWVAYGAALLGWTPLAQAMGQAHSI